MKASEVRGTFEGLLKQIDMSSAGPYAQATVSQWFPEFERQAGAGRELGVKFVLSAHDMNVVQGGRRRRFSGGDDLPVTRYHSVSSSADGNDFGTLCYEFMTYWSVYATSDVYPALFDTTSHPNAAEAIAEARSLALTAADPSYRAEAIPLLDSGRPLLIIQPLRTKESLDAVYEDAEIAGLPAVLELAIRSVCIPDCLDLRLPTHREFFCDRLTEFPEINAHRQNPPQRHRTTIDFMAALPHLILPTVGGDMFHLSVGRRLRELGYAGFVFPSARNDSFVVNAGDQIVKHQGWNFVDYRDAPVLSLDRESPDRLSRWQTLTLDDLGVDVYCVDKWNVEGKQTETTGFKTDGVAEHEWRRIDHEISLMWQGRTPGFFYDRFSDRPID